MKFSDNPDKTTNPGIKNVWRLYDKDGSAKADILALSDEVLHTDIETTFYHPSGDYRQFSFSPSAIEPLLKKRIENGKRTGKSRDPESTLKESRLTMIQQLETFDKTYKRLLNPHVYKVSITEKLKNLKLEHIQNRIHQQN